MKITLSTGYGRQLGGMLKKLKNSISWHKIVLVVAAVPIMSPVAMATVPVKSSREAIELIALRPSGDATVVDVPTREFTIEIRQSPYQAEMAKKKTLLIQSAITSSTEDPSLEVKREWVKRAAAHWGIDWKILEAVWQVESGKRWRTSVRSYAGATGPCQFMPGTWRAYAVDGNGDGVKDVTDARDCLFAAAKLLAVNGAQEGDNVRALRRYNNSTAYVLKVLRIAQSI